MSESSTGKAWPDYRAVWRWHFYASLFCMPFVVILSLSGAIYLFKPQIDRWEDRAYNHVMTDKGAVSVTEQVEAALKAIPDSIPISFELPESPQGASRVIVRHADQKQRVYVHPGTAEVLHIRDEEDTLIRQVRSLHGQLWMGTRGSNLVELASSWTIIMIVTGLYLWWPRSLKGLGGVLYPRFQKGSRVMWRDLHSVTGIWISAFALFLLATGLPWAKFWGSYFRSVRSITETALVQQDWTLGGETSDATATEGEHASHRSSVNRSASSRSGSLRNRGEPAMPQDMEAFNRVHAAVASLGLAHPVSFSPPIQGSSHWTAKSDAQNRTLRTTLTIDGQTGKVLSQENFSDRKLLDRLVAIGISAHEGQLFGWLNQLLGLLTALGLVVLSGSGYMMWWRRRDPGKLGAPPVLSNSRRSTGLILIVIALAIYLPMFGATLLIMVILEKLVLSRIPPVSKWLGLESSVIGPT